MAVTGITLLGVCLHLSAGLNTWEVPGRDPWRSISPDLDHMWFTYKAEYNRTYRGDAEEVRRRLFWEDTVRMIDEHNSAYRRGRYSFYLGENDFSDMAEDEFERMYLRGLTPPPDVEEDYPPVLNETDLALPASFDWERRGMVTRVKHQGTCGCCWAFAAVGALEAKHKIATGQLVNLSEQNLVDCCNWKYGNRGCMGGWMTNAFRYIKNAGGVDSEQCYPYRRRQSNCRFRRNCITAQLRGYKNVPRSESSLQAAVARKGPVSVAVDTTDKKFWSYRGGVYNNPYCKPHVHSHAMLVVGYGSYRSRSYWKVKNSYGPRWGRNGYVFMSRNRNNQCGIANYASYPV